MSVEKAKCKWIYKEHQDYWTIGSDYWETGCDNAFCLNEGTPKDNKMIYCPFCGKEIESE